MPPIPHNKGYDFAMHVAKKFPNVKKYSWPIVKSWLRPCDLQTLVMWEVYLFIYFI